MMKTERPLWGRGIMVSPQHFQQQAAYAAWTAEVIARMGLNHPWGVVEATFEPEMLKLGRLQAHRLQVRFQDGTMIDTDNADALPSALSLDGASGEAVIVLALPLMQANGGNCLKPEEVAERPARFRQRWRDVRNQFGDDTRQIAVIQPELTLRFAHQDNSDYLTCPLVRLQRDSQGAWLIDETFLPPLLQIQGSRWLATQLEQLLIQLRARLTRLMAMRRESNERMADFAVADVSLFWLLNALNSAEPVLGYFLRYRQSPPERLYPELARLAGSLLTFSLTHQANAVPIYQHDQLNAVFPPLFDLLSDLLEASLHRGWWRLRWSMMSGCTSGRRVCTMPGCGKGLITTCRFVRRYRSPNCRSSFRASAKWAVRIMSKPSSTPRGQGCPSRHCVMCRRRSRYVWKISISASMCPILWQRKCCRAAPVCFTCRGCSVSLNLNFLRYYERE